MKCKSNYKDMKKYAEYKRNCQRRYRERTGSKKYERRAWTVEEDKLVLNSPFTDRELGERICRSVAAIWTRRNRLNNGESNNAD